MLKTLPAAAITPLIELSRFRLDSNPLVCDCKLKWLKAYAANNTNLMEVAATCFKPDELNGVAVTEVAYEQFNCPDTPPFASRELPTIPLTTTTTPHSVASDGRPVSQISNFVPTVSRVVGMKRPELTAQPVDVEVREGDRVYMDCAADGEPTPKIAWFHNENEVITNDIEPSSRYHLLSDGRLMIDRATSLDQGRYGCMATNEAGEAISGPAMLLLQQDEPAVRTRFITQPRDQTVSIGGSISLTCTASGSAELSWYKDGEAYSIEPSRATMLSSGTMLITDVVPSDAGLYRCTARVGEEALHATASVSVQERPYFVEEVTSSSVVEGGTAYFNCEVGGFPEPHINWIKNGEELRNSLRYTITHNNTNLRISDVRLSDAGRYECEASNTIATVSSYGQLTVRERVPPSFTEQPSSVSAEMGSDITLTCSASGDPHPTISWHHADQAIPLNEETEDKYEVNGEGYLSISNISLEDAGSYECHAINSVGTARLNIHLQVVGAVERIYPGDRFVEEAVSTARLEVDNAADQTLRELRDKSKPLSSSDLLALFKFPSQAAQNIGRSAEIFERTLELIVQKVHDADQIELDNKDIYNNVREILSPNHIQIIAELSGCAESRTPIDCTNMCFHKKYRSFDGTCNNLRRPMLGSSLTKFNRWLPAVYENNFNLPVGWNASKLYHGFSKPSARLVSTRVMSSHEIEADNVYTSFLMQWGQFLDHDITLTPMSVSHARFSDGRHCNSTCENQSPCFPIQTPPGDPRLTHRPCIGVTRSSAACGSGMTSVFFKKIAHREQLNELTSFIDASNVYGSDESYSRSLRDLSRDRGLLRTGLLQTTDGKYLLPFNIDAPMDCQIDPTKAHIPCFLAGDLRANEQLGLIAIHTLFMREHNRIALELASLNEHWDGDMVYHESRKIVGAIMQHITYQHWLPKVLGPVGMSILGEYKGYNPTTNPSIMNVFASAAFRFGHSLINPILYRYNSTMQEHSAGHLPLHKAFFAPFRVIEEGGIDPILRGLFGTPAKMPTSTQIFNEELTEKLFKLAHAVALDLAALNIQRGRDHALPSYTEWRKKCGLSDASEFDELANEIPDVKLRMKLEQIYGHPGNIDLFVGAMVEKLLPGARIGPTFTCILAEQFKRLRDGDRFYYENPGVFSSEQLAEIKQVTLGHLLCMSADNITSVPKDAFRLFQYPRQYLQCDSGKVPDLNLKVWAHCCHDCENAGDFQSITDNIVRRRRRSAGLEYSYADEKPSVTSQEALGGTKLREQQIEGLEDTIEQLAEMVKSLQEKITTLQKKKG
ncbi:peroxidasin homolog isoform X2 [Watersipora subatra]|uniref:peroxidasin homolog isoform X2 n=1 Tax=Watersipora subatra TaxID=2589382 RepID=UPI00355C5C63